MTFLAELRGQVDRLAVFTELDVASAELPHAVLSLSDASVRQLIADAGELARDVQKLQTLLAGAAARRSTRERGGEGLSVATGHRTPVELIQATTGVTRAEATRAVRVGEALLDSAAPAGDGGLFDDADAGARVDAGVAARMPVWHAPLDEALLAGAVTPAQYNAILTGLGEPPVDRTDDPETLIAAWCAGARELVGEATSWTVEQLSAHARTLRDMLDPEGAEDRFARRFERRGYRMWTDPDGQQRASLTFDDEMGAWVRAMLDAALRPRRGGPRFVAEGERDEADRLADDPRTNEQLACDLIIDVLRAGALAQPGDVFGAREPGVRVVVTDDATGRPRDAVGRLAGAGFVEDGGAALPGSVIDRAGCIGGHVEVTVDACGNPLAVGREQRLFTKTQRLALAIRDGGCLWPGCERPPSFCEAHHCIAWSDGGATDCDVGVLLCRFHHLTLHNAGWRIAPQSGGGFVLHPPPGDLGEPIHLRSKSPLRWLWDPPPDRTRWRDGAGITVGLAGAA